MKLTKLVVVSVVLPPCERAMASGDEQHPGFYQWLDGVLIGERREEPET